MKQFSVCSNDLSLYLNQSASFPLLEQRYREWRHSLAKLAPLFEEAPRLTVFISHAWHVFDYRSREKAGFLVNEQELKDAQYFDQFCMDLFLILRASGFNVLFDWDSLNAEGIETLGPRRFMEKIDEADVVLVICTSTYQKRSSETRPDGSPTGVKEEVDRVLSRFKRIRKAAETNPDSEVELGFFVPLIIEDLSSYMLGDENIGNSLLYLDLRDSRLFLSNMWRVLHRLWSRVHFLWPKTLMMNKLRRRYVKVLGDLLAFEDTITAQVGREATCDELYSDKLHLVSLYQTLRATIELLELDELPSFKLESNEDKRSCDVYYEQALRYELGKGDVLQNDVEAFEQYKKLAADCKHSPSQYRLACMYFEGRGTIPDIAQGIRYLKLSCDGGYFEAEYKLSQIYRKGLYGIKCVVDQANLLLLRSALKEDSVATEELKAVLVTFNIESKSLQPFIKDLFELLVRLNFENLPISWDIPQLMWFLYDERAAPEVFELLEKSYRLKTSNCCLFEDCRDRYQSTLFHRILQDWYIATSFASQWYESIFDLLLPCVTNYELLDHFGNSLLDIAAESKNMKAFNELVKKNPHVHLQVDRLLEFFEFLRKESNKLNGNQEQLHETFASFSVLESLNLDLKFRMAIEHILGGYLTSLPLSPYQIIGCNSGSRILPLDLFEFNPEKQEYELKVKKTNSNGRCTVSNVSSGEYGLYFKFFPEFPGLEEAVSSLSYDLIGFGGSKSELFKITETIKIPYLSAEGKMKEVIMCNIPVLVSLEIPGPTLKDVFQNSGIHSMTGLNVFENLNKEALFKMMLIQMLINPEDGKSDNFIVEEYGNPSAFRFVAIDNDHAFVPALREINHGRVKINSRTILYAFDEMNEEIPLTVRDHFLSLDIDTLLRTWLRRLRNLNERYSDLYPSHYNSFVGIPFATNAIARLYTKLTKLQKTFTSLDNNVTPLSVLLALEPWLKGRYSKVFLDLKNLRIPQRFEYIEGKAATQTITRPIDLLDSYGIKNDSSVFEMILQGKQFSPGQATLELEEIIVQTKEFDQIASGVLSTFRNLKEENLIFNALKGIDFQTLSPLMNDAYLEVIQDKLSEGLLCKLVLMNHQTFKSSFLKTLPESSLARITFLQLIGSKEFDLKMLLSINQLLTTLQTLVVENCIKLKHIIQTSSGVFSTASDPFLFSTLANLRFTHCAQLEKVMLNAPSLQSLVVESCANLVSLELEGNSCVSISLLSCGSLESVFLNTVLLKQIHCSNCPVLENHCIYHPMQVHPYLRKIIIENCPRIDDWIIEINWIIQENMELIMQTDVMFDALDEYKISRLDNAGYTSLLADSKILYQGMGMIREFMKRLQKFSTRYPFDTSVECLSTCALVEMRLSAFLLPKYSETAETMIAKYINSKCPIVAKTSHLLSESTGNLTQGQQSLQRRALYHLKAVTQSFISSNPLFEKEDAVYWTETTTQIASSVLKLVHINTENGDNIDVCRLLKVKTIQLPFIPTNARISCELIPGVVFRKDVSALLSRHTSLLDPKSSSLCHILIINSNLEPVPQEYRQIIREKTWNERFEGLTSPPSLILVVGSASVEVIDYFATQGILVLSNMKATNIHRLSRMNGKPVHFKSGVLSGMTGIGDISCGFKILPIDYPPAAVSIDNKELCKERKRLHYIFIESNHTSPSGCTLVVSGTRSRSYFQQFKKFLRMVVRLAYQVTLEVAFYDYFQVSPLQTRVQDYYSSIQKSKNTEELKEFFDVHPHAILWEDRLLLTSSINIDIGLPWTNDLQDSNLYQRKFSKQLNYEDHQSIVRTSFIMSREKIQSSNHFFERDDLLKPAEIKKFHYYSDLDMSLGEFILNNLLQSTKLDQKLCFMHKNRCIEITVEESHKTKSVDQKIPNSLNYPILSRVSCRMCHEDNKNISPEVPLLPLPDDVRNMSLGKFVEILLYSNATIYKKLVYSLPPTHQSKCFHLFLQNYEFSFFSNGFRAMFQSNPIYPFSLRTKLYSNSKPSSTRDLFQCKEEKKLEMLESPELLRFEKEISNVILNSLIFRERSSPLEKDFEVNSDQAFALYHNHIFSFEEVTITSSNISYEECNQVLETPGLSFKDEKVKEEPKKKLTNEEQLISIDLRSNHEHMQYQNGLPLIGPSFESIYLNEMIVYYKKQFEALRNCYYNAEDTNPSDSQYGNKCFQSDLSAYSKNPSDSPLEIREISEMESIMFVDFAPAYFEYMARAYYHDHPTLLTKILGIYTFNIIDKHRKKEKKHYIIIEKIFYQRKITRNFHLKGFLRDRYKPEKNPQRLDQLFLQRYQQEEEDGKFSANFSHDEGPSFDIEKNLNDDQTEDLRLFDENFLLYTNGKPLPLKPRSANFLQEALSNDRLFLYTVHVTGYSINVGIEDKEDFEIIVGVDDYLRQFDIGKRFERLKGYFQGLNVDQAEVLSPSGYRKRMTTAMERYFALVPDKWYDLDLE